jgi:serine protease Do
VGAQLVGLDRETDLALLKVQDLGPLAALELADSDQVRPGQIVMAFGSPLGLESSASLGVISAGARQIRPEDPMIYLQTDASINPGNSGGPLVDAAGRVVGLNTFILSQSGGNEGIGFAAPSNIVRSVYDQLRTHGRVRRGEVGIHPQTITPELADGLGLDRETGVVLADVQPGGPADRAGLEIGDVVVALDGKPMENARQLQVNLYPRRVGESVGIELVRAGRPISVVVSLTERPGDLDRLQTLARPEEHLVSGLGVLGLTLTADIVELVPRLRGGCGVLVAAAAETAAPVRGEPLRPGDVIYAVNQRPICTLSELRALLAPMTSGAMPVLQIERDGALMFLVVQIQ